MARKGILRFFSSAEEPPAGERISHTEEPPAVEKEMPKLEFTRQRIFGTETEFGSVGFSERDLTSRTGYFISNGGKLYPDCHHLEYASPETRNPRDAVVWSKAGEIAARPHVAKLFKNNVAVFRDPYDDRQFDVTFGAHENYFTMADIEGTRQILPFFVTRIIFAGSGLLSQSGKFYLSQRAPFMGHPFSTGSTRNRGIIDERQENHATVMGWRRLHQLSGDANMCEVAEFLKLGTTGLVLDLLEDQKLPKFDYNSDFGPRDIQNISEQGPATTLFGTNFQIGGAIGIQGVYLDAAKNAYAGRDSGTDHLLTVWGDTLEKLADEPRDLFGRVDWVTKKVLIEEYAKRHRLDMTNPRLRNIDLQYHDCDPSTGLFYALQRAGKTERITTDEEIADAAENPPQDTRAKFRGAVVRAHNKSNERGNLSLISFDWSRLKYSTEEQWCRSCQKYHEAPKVIDIQNPFDTYDSLVEQIGKIVQGK